MGDYSNKKVLVVDNGLFVELATMLVGRFGKVCYTSPWVNAFPKSNSTLIGEGIPGVERVPDVWSAYDADLFVFPDVYDGRLQLHLIDQGKRVWGSRMGEELELNRAASKKYLKDVANQFVGKYEEITGLSNLREHLKDHPDTYVKVSTTRGDMETFYSKNYSVIEPRLDELEYVLGAKKAVMKFIVEPSIPDAVEIGYDGYSICGQFPDEAMLGIEVKDRGYLGHFTKSHNMPVQVDFMNTSMGPTLREFGYRNFFSMEARITKNGIPWVIDPCTRFGSPPGELCQVMYTNLDDIFWHGSDGDMVQPIPAGEWGAELLLHSSWADKNWMPVSFPEEIRPYVKLRNLTVINGKYYVVPQSVGLPEIGAVVATGATPEEAMKTCLDRADKIEGHNLEVYSNCLEDAEEQRDKLRGFGIEL